MKVKVYGVVLVVVVVCFAMILLAAPPSCRPQPPEITFTSPTEGGEVASCEGLFGATFLNVDEERLLTVTVFVNETQITTNGSVTIGGETVTISDFSLTTEGVSFSACNLPPGPGETFTVNVGEEDDLVTGTVNFTVVVDKASCKAILDAGVSVGDGRYFIDPMNDENFFPVYCDMTREGGGWTLVMKVDGNRQTFTYDAGIWRNMDTLAPTSTNMDAVEAKLPSYNNVSFNELLLGMTVQNDTRWLRVNFTGNSLYALIADNNYRQTSFGRNAWKSLINGSSLQPNCNREGFNTVCGGDTRIRIGIVNNQENDCGTCDSRIGFGAYGSYCGQDPNNSCGNEARCSPDNGDKSIRAFGYILVR